MGVTSQGTAVSRSERLPITVSRRPNLGKTINRAIAYTILIILTLFLAFPLVWMLLTSVKNQREVFSSFLPKTLDFSNFQRIWMGLDLPRHLANSVYVTALTVTVVVVVSTLAGYVFARYQFRGRDLIFYIFLGAMMIPGQAILIPMFTFLKSMNLLNTLTGLSLSFLGGSVAFAIFLMRAFFRTLPSELGDAGKIDGCTEFGVFRYVYLPLARPGIATVTIFQFMGTWNEFMFSTTFISSPDLKTIQPALYQAIGRYTTDYTALSSGLVLAIIPIVVLYLLLQRQFIKGLTAGAIKG
jgi:ABC-type glycerol-3-phosphate transport system permease component